MLLLSLLSCSQSSKPQDPDSLDEWIGLLITPEQIILSVGQETQLTATALNANHESVNLTDSVDWMVEFYDVLSISEALDSEGLLSAISEGNSRIYAQYETLRSQYVDVIVTSATLEELTITPSEISLTEGDRVQLQAIGTFSNGDSGNVTQQSRWITGNSAIAQFDDPGILEAVGIGTTSIYASYDSIDSSSVTVDSAPYVENGRPDLIIEDISVQGSGEDAIVSVVATNQGARGASGFWLDVFVGPDTPEFHSIGDSFYWIEYLGPNQGRTIALPLSLYGDSTVWSVIDTTELVNESHENNNIENTPFSASQQ